MSIYAALASDRTKNPEKRHYRRMTSAEARALGHAWFLFVSNDGKIRQARPSGQLKTWKTRPGDYRQPVKFGLYESTTLVPDRVDPTLAAFENSGGAMPIVACETEGSN